MMSLKVVYLDFYYHDHHDQLISFVISYIYLSKRKVSFKNKSKLIINIMLKENLILIN